MQCRRDAGRLTGARARPAVAPTDDHALAHEAAYDLLDEQRIAAGPRGDEVLELTELVGRHGEKTAHERPRLVAGQGMDADDRLRGSGDLGRSCLRAVREEYHQGALREVIDDVPQQIDGGAIRPVDIVDHEHEGLVLHPPLDQGARRQHDLALQLLGLDVSGLGVLHAEHVAQHRGDGFGLFGSCPERAKAFGQLLPGDPERIGRIDPVGLAEERAEDAIGRLAQRRARCPPDNRARETALRVVSREELVEEPRLARSGLALHPVKGASELVQLVGTPDERCREPQRREPTAGPGLEQRAEEPMDDE